MTKKKFIKTLRAYGLHRYEINTLVNKIVEKHGKLSYNDAMKQMWWTICKFIVNKQPMLDIDWNYKPVEFVDTDIYKIDYRMCYPFMSVDLTKEPDKCLVVRSNAD